MCVYIHVNAATGIYMKRPSKYIFIIVNTIISLKPTEVVFGALLTVLYPKMLLVSIG